MNAILFPLDRLEQTPFEAGAPKPERLLSGAPAFRTWTFEESKDGKTFAGVWECTPGSWRVVYDEWEFCSIISGVSVLTRDGHEPVRLGPGAAIVIEPGFVGTWQVVETTRKLFVVRID